MAQRKQLVAGNWKLQGSCELVQQMVHALTTQQPAFIPTIEIALFPPAIYIPLMAKQCANTGIAYGAQTMSEHAKGAYTGEIAASMLKEFGCHYVILGHSERRSLFGETDAQVAAKAAFAVVSGLTPIICIGETLAQYEAGTTLEVLHRQLNAILTLPEGVQILTQSVIAYEPIWAIGTGKTATPEVAQNVHGNLREFLAQYNPTLAQSVQILYGGSVKPDNAAALAAMPDIDGFLVGGAALVPEQFVAICAEVAAI